MAHNIIHLYVCFNISLKYWMTYPLPYAIVSPWKKKMLKENPYNKVRIIYLLLLVLADMECSHLFRAYDIYTYIHDVHI